MNEEDANEDGPPVEEVVSVPDRGAADEVPEEEAETIEEDEDEESDGDDNDNEDDGEDVDPVTAVPDDRDADTVLLPVPDKLV